MSIVNSQMLKKELAGEVTENESLAKYTSFKIGGPAKYFFVAKDSKQLIKAIQLAKANDLSYFVLGGGSNVLIADSGFDGLVIKAENREMKIQGTTVQADAGMSLAALSIATVQAGLTGLEFGVGIPGTVGGAVRGNAGCFGREMKDVVTKVLIVDEAGQPQELSNADCQFAYRDSLFKNNEQMIISVELELSEDKDKQAQALIDEYRTKKTDTQDFSQSSAGCIFKNPGPDQYAGQLIDELGLKGKQIGKAMVSPKHANFIVNTGQATAEDVITLISLIKEKVRSHYGVQLQEEIKLLGF